MDNGLTFQCSLDRPSKLDYNPLAVL